MHGFITVTSYTVVFDFGTSDTEHLNSSHRTKVRARTLGQLHHARTLTREPPAHLQCTDITHSGHYVDDTVRV